MGSLFSKNKMASLSPFTGPAMKAAGKLKDKKKMNMNAKVPSGFMKSFGKK